MPKVPVATLAAAISEVHVSFICGFGEFLGGKTQKSNARLGRDASNSFAAVSHLWLKTFRIDPGECDIIHEIATRTDVPILL